MRTTIKDIAAACNVSVATVSMALNGRKGVNPETQLRVIHMAQAMNYAPNYSARSLVKQKSDCIGLIIPEITNPFYSTMVDAFTHIAEESDLRLVLGISNNSRAREAECVQTFLSQQVQGVILVPMLVDRPDVRHLDMLRKVNIPIVFCTDRYEGCAEPLVMCDFARGQYEITKHLIDKGVRSFWFVSTNMHANFATLRREGYLKALREAGIPDSASRELMLEEPKYEAAYKAADRIIDDLPGAVVCINDIMTMAIMKRLNERGVRIPQDVSVVGFDDVLYANLVTPPLTTVRQPLPEICRKAMQLMEQKLHAGEAQSEVARGQAYLIPPELIVRESSL